MNDTERAMRARVAGRTAMAVRTVWALQVGPLQSRCIRVEGGFQLQVRDLKGWQDMFEVQDDPVRMLRALTNSDVVLKAYADTRVTLP